MPEEPQQPLSRTHRKLAFFLLVALFVALIPFLYLYATGYRLEFGSGTNFVSTGGMYIAAEREGTQIFIDEDIVPNPRVFRQAFYAQNLIPKTHRVTVQREGYHTWVKELPVYAHIVTEAQAFNLPLIPTARVVTEWQTANGSAVASEAIATSSLVTTNIVFVATSTATSTYERNGEYRNLLSLFATSTDSSATEEGVIIDLLLFEPATTTASTTDETATTTKELRGVRLYEQGSQLYAAWAGASEQMPYYYCSEPFERYSTSTKAIEEERPRISLEQITEEEQSAPEFIHPVQIVPEDSECLPVIQIDTKGETLRYFDFFLGNSDLVLLVLESGVYVIEIDNRAWQNMQPLLLGTDLDARIENGNVYVYDQHLIYQMVLEE